MALEQVRASRSQPAVVFTLIFEPFQLQPAMPATADRQVWSLQHKHLDSAAGQAIYQDYVGTLAAAAGATLRFDGPVGNTLHAHRVMQHLQSTEGPETANRLVDALYRLYFCEAKHPAADDTLMEACVEAGVNEADAREVVRNKALGEKELRTQLRTVASDVDAVPVVRVEGRRRDITLIGAKEVEAYVKALETVIKESS
ncbi:hypothetical protein S40285_07782 [Stachybotrys chlorohalonatus IBT 40285]|uniref:DSBA-like thioredoxin domain-containing protein n=1 Tax=Stachybotrys chlorohalonatus (strain IBT 40285) TaxID=1283841 RepID=A0A084QH57_STAC4|nr:hypothetical protein S40285_07782 [Stachybotrys chlorohalonata IBT 40285]